MAEKTLESWTVNFIAEGNRFLGELKITESLLCITAQYDMSLFGKLPPAILERRGEQMIAEFHAEDIVSAAAKTSFFNKRIILVVNDGSGKTQEIIVDYGMMSIKKMQSAIEIFMKRGVAQ